MPEKRPSPSQSATEYKPGTIKKGNDNNMWVVKVNKKGIHRWVRQKEKYPSYLTLDNGGHPFKVTLEGTTIKVYTNPTPPAWDAEDQRVPKSEYTNLVATYNNIKHAFIGSDNPREKWSTGNSILLATTDATSNNEYIFIGDRIYSFKTEDKIMEYYSRVGNSAVPYPVAVGEKYIYIFMDQVYIDKSEFTNIQDPYDDYTDEYISRDKLSPKERMKTHKFINLRNLVNSAY